MINPWSQRLGRGEVRCWNIEARESPRPTIVRTIDGYDQVARMTAWVDPADGAVIKTALDLNIDSTPRREGFLPLPDRRPRRARPLTVRFLVLLSLAAVAAGACGGPTSAAALLKDSIESIGNEMMSLREPRRGVEYHDRSGKPFRVAFVPQQADQQALAAAGINATELAQCRQSGLTVVAVGEADRTDCATLPQLTVPELRVLHKAVGEPVRMTLVLDAKGYRLDEVR
jgi:hypothetical protein